MPVISSVGLRVCRTRFSVASQLAHAFERKVLTLQGDKDAIGRRQRADGQVPERGRAVEEDQVVVSDRLDRLPQSMLPPGLTDELDLDTDQVAVGRNDVEAGKAGRSNAVRQGRLTAQHLVEQRRRRLDREPSRGVALWVAVDQQHALLERTEGGAEVDGGGGLSHAPLLVDDGDDSHLDPCHEATAQPLDDSSSRIRFEWLPGSGRERLIRSVAGIGGSSQAGPDQHPGVLRESARQGLPSSGRQLQRS